MSAPLRFTVVLDRPDFPGQQFGRAVAVFQIDTGGACFDELHHEIGHHLGRGIEACFGIHAERHSDHAGDLADRASRVSGGMVSPSA